MANDDKTNKQPTVQELNREMNRTFSKKTAC